MQPFEDRSFLKHARRLVGLTQRDLASKAKVKLSMIADLESGRQKLTTELAVRLYVALANVAEMQQGKSAEDAASSTGIAVKNVLPVWRVLSASRMASKTGISPDRLLLLLRRIYDLTHPQAVESRLKFGLWTLGMGFVLGLIAGAMLWR